TEGATMTKTQTQPPARTGLRFVLVVPFILQIIVAVGLVGYLSFQSGQRAVLDLASQLRQELTARIDSQLRSYFDVPLNLVEINSAAMANEEVSFALRGNVFLFQQE